jgi:hypothetical protein
MLRWFPNSKLLLHASHAALPVLNSSKLPTVVDAADLFSKLSIKQSEIQNLEFRCLSEATLYHHNVFTFTLFLPEGRADVAWEPSNKMMLFLPPRKIKCLSLQPLISSLNLLFIYPSHLSLSPRLQRVNKQKTYEVSVFFFAAERMQITSFSDIVPCRLFEVNRRFKGLYCLHHQGDVYP